MAPFVLLSLQKKTLKTCRKYRRSGDKILLKVSQNKLNNESIFILTAHHDHIAHHIFHETCTECVTITQCTTFT